MQDFINFLLNVSIICLGSVLKDIFNVDEFLFFIIVFWVYIITNAFVNEIHLTKEYIWNLYNYYFFINNVNSYYINFILRHIKALALCVFIIYLILISIVYTFAAYQLKIPVFTTIIQLVCGVVVNDLNQCFEDEEKQI